MNATYVAFKIKKIVYTIENKKLENKFKIRKEYE